MLFFVRREMKYPRGMAPDALETLRIQTMAYVLKLRREGKWLAGGRMVHEPVMYFICDCDSTAEMQSLLANSPLAPFAKDEVTPLIATEESMERATQRLESLNAAAVPTRRTAVVDSIMRTQEPGTLSPAC
jgi:muconolactone delta-isomerase